jgi:anti-sigma regulatory factor (Ser/Thr protein kinase)
MEPTMTTNLAGQERTRRRAPLPADELRRPSHPRSCLEVSLERHPDPDDGGISRKDAAWPQRLRRLSRASLRHWGRPDLAETAELLLTELVTNALRHACGPEIGIRVYFQDDHLVIEVNDGSPAIPVPRCAGPDDENGRGLFLVEALAASWGVSPDGVTTWCTLPLTEGPPQMDGALSVTVCDRMPGAAEIRAAADGDESGRGLPLVDALVRENGGAWGTSDDGAETWCSLTIPDGEKQ